MALENQKNKGVLIVISGPSGAGKRNYMQGIT